MRKNKKKPLLEKTEAEIKEELTKEQYKDLKFKKFKK